MSKPFLDWTIKELTEAMLNQKDYDTFIKMFDDLVEIHKELKKMGVVK